MQYTARIVDAFALAFELHASQERKGTGVPYITHTMAAAATVGGYGGDEDQFIAALLHDAVEDQGGQDTLLRIRERFGERVAAYVLECSDSTTSPKPPWRERKERFIERIAGASPETKLIVASDKLHNARATVSNLGEIGNEVWQRFKGGRDGTLWYYTEVLRALGTGWAHPILRELAGAVDALNRYAFELEEK